MQIKPLLRYHDPRWSPEQPFPRLNPGELNRVRPFSDPDVSPLYNCDSKPAVGTHDLNKLYAQYLKDIKWMEKNPGVSVKSKEFPFPPFFCFISPRCLVQAACLLPNHAAPTLVSKNGMKARMHSRADSVYLRPRNDPLLPQQITWWQAQLDTHHISLSSRARAAHALDFLLFEEQLKRTQHRLQQEDEEEHKGEAQQDEAEQGGGKQKQDGGKQKQSAEQGSAMQDEAEQEAEATASEEEEADDSNDPDFTPDAAAARFTPQSRSPTTRSRRSQHKPEEQPEMEEEKCGAASQH